ncbi:MAG: hypothetical protein R3B82_22505 [Sandaracinaceae bacterium]
MRTCFIGGHQGRGDRIDFTSFSHRRLYRDAHESDQNELSYFITEHPEDRDRLCWCAASGTASTTTPRPAASSRSSSRIAPASSSPKVPLDAAIGEWTETWDTREVTHQPNRPLVQVKISLTVADEHAEHDRRTYVTRAQPMVTWGLNHAVYNSN